MPAQRTPGTVANETRRAVLELIESADLSSGDRIGSERELAERLAVNRSTLRVVLAGLEQSGAIVRRSGRNGGVFVGKPRIDRAVGQGGVVPFPTYLARQGYEASATVVGALLTSASNEVARGLELAEGEQVYHLRRVWLADKSPVALESAWLDAARFPGLLDNPLNGAIYELLREKYGLERMVAHEAIEGVQLTEEEAALLGTDDCPVGLRIRRVTVEEGGRPFEFSVDLFRADKTRVLATTRGSLMRERLVEREGGFDIKSGGMS